MPIKGGRKADVDEPTLKLINHAVEEAVKSAESSVKKDIQSEVMCVRVCVLTILCICIHV